MIKLRTFEACGLPDVPDLLATAGRGLDFWIELKCVKSAQTLIPFRKGQPKWIEDYIHDGGIVKVLVMDQTAHLLYLLELTSPIDIRTLAKSKLRDAFNSFGVAVIRQSLSDWAQTTERALLVSLSRNFPTQSPQGDYIKAILAQSSRKSHTL
jgi:hypothetical protein